VQYKPVSTTFDRLRFEWLGHYLYRAYLPVPSIKENRVWLKVRYNTNWSLIRGNLWGQTPKLTLIKSWTNAEVWDGGELTVTEKGIPLGSPVSQILANLFLDELDEAMLKNGEKYVRFADDFLVLCKSPEKAKRSVEFTNEILEGLLLKLDESYIVSFDQGFRYLGVTFVRSLIMVPFDKQKKERKVLYYPPPLNMDAYCLKKKRNW
jgi:hypothetical protein